MKLPEDSSSHLPQSVSSNIKLPSVQTLLDAIPCPVYYKDREGIILVCNQAFHNQIIGDPKFQLIGKSMYDLTGIIPSDLIDICLQKDSDILQNPGHQSYEANVLCSDGQNRIFTFHKSTFTDENGRIQGIAGLMLDITTAKDAEAELKNYRDKLEEMVAQRSEALIVTNNQLSKEIEERRKTEAALQINEKRYRSIFENNSTATILIEEDMTISMANDKAEKMVGIPRDEFVGRAKMLDFITPRYRDRIKMYHELRMQDNTQIPKQFEFQITDGKGVVRDVIANVRGLSDSQQTVASLLDITEKNQLLKERQQLAAVIDQSAQAIIMTDKHGKVEYINEAFETISEYDRETCIGKTLDAPFFSDEDRKILKQMTFMVSGNDFWNGRMENQKRSGKPYIADTRIFPICDDRGKATNLVCVKTDVTHEVQLEKQLQQAQKMEAIGTLAGGIAHDFNNILGGIQGYTEISLLDTDDADSIKRNLGRILDGCRRAKELVQNIMMFSRKSDEEIKPIEIQMIVKEALKLLRASIPSTIEFKQKISSDPIIVRATPTQVHQIIMNLCTNASHAMLKSGGVMEVILENVGLTAADCENRPNLTPGPYCRLAVCDTGDGMDANTRDHIFEPYFTTKDQTGGTGLGLSVVHGIVQSFGGAIFVESKPGLGTTFEIYLSRIEETLNVDAPVQVSPPTGKERVLVADDELFILEIMTDMLESLGYHVETAGGGQEAIEKFSAAPERYDIVIADLTMPKLTGTQLAIKIKELRNDIPIILTTGMSFAPNSQQDQFKEFSAVLNKPILYEDLAKTLRSVIDGAKPTQQRHF